MCCLLVLVRVERTGAVAGAVDDASCVHVNRPAFARPISSNGFNLPDGAKVSRFLPLVRREHTHIVFRYLISIQFNSLFI